MSQDSNDIKIAVLQNQMDNIEKKVDDGFADIKRLIQEQSDRIDGKMSEKANKWVERAMIAAATAIGLAIIAAIMGQILIK
jgi:CHASE3 domain sensor protein